MQGSSKSAEGHLSRVERGKFKRGVSELLAELEAVHNYHHAWTEYEKATWAEAVAALWELESSLAKAPKS